MTEPMDDAELAALRHIHEREGLSLYPPGNTAFDRLFARLDAERTRADAAEAERDAAVARAMPEPRLLRTVEEVEALPDIAARYMVRLKTDVRFDLWERFSPTVWGREHWRAPSGGLFPASFLVGALVSGPIPDLPTPTAAQEG